MHVVDSLATSSDWDPRAYSAEDLARDLGLTVTALCRIANQIDVNGYREFTQHKRRKTRVISAPSYWLKPIQRKLADTLLLRLPVSTQVYSRRGCNVVQNADQHLGRAYVLSMDLSDCYPSTTLAMVRSALAATGLPKDVVGLVARLVTYRGRLPQGPPTSAAILDRVLFPLDERLARLAAAEGATYTRYADDLSFSSDNSLAAVRKQATKLIRKHGYSLRARKTRASGPGSMHVVTGIVVGAELHALPTYLEEIQRRIRRFRRGRPGKERSLRGQITWVGRLNEEEARRLHAQMNEATVERARRRARRSVLHSRANSETATRPFGSVIER